jgi:methylthioribose-1-phosphate isomerase
MKNLSSMALKYQNGKLLILDQQMLPHQEKWIESKTPEDMTKIILDLKTRGAPLIGVAAALSLALYAEEGNSSEDVIKKAELLRQSRPTAVNLMNALDRLIAVGEKGAFNSADLTREAENIFEEDVKLCEQMANIGSELIKPVIQADLPQLERELLLVLFLGPPNAMKASIFLLMKPDPFYRAAA